MDEGRKVFWHTGPIIFIVTITALQSPIKVLSRSVLHLQDTVTRGLGPT